MENDENPHQRDSMYELFVEESQQGVMMLQGNPPRIIYTNAAMTRISGYTREELLAFSVEDMRKLTHPDDIVRVEREYETSIKDGNGYDIIYRIRRKDGEYIWIHDISTRTYQEGETPFSIGMYTDITEKKRIELALKESEEKYRTLIEHMQDGIAILQDGKIKFANNALANMLGYSVLELQGSDFISYIAPESQQIVSERYRRRMTGEMVTQDYDIFAVHKDGSKHILRLKADTIEYGGKPAVVSTISDITERKNIELALKESEEKYRTLVENMQDGVAIIQDGNFVFTNTMLSKIVGFTSDELRDRPFLGLVAPEDKAYVAERYQAEISGEGIPQSLDIRAIKKDGSLPYIRISGILMEYQGRPAVLVTITDITERKEFEDRLRLVQYSIDHASDPVFWIDKDGRFVYSNEAARDYLGYSLDELSKITVWDMYPEFATERGPEMLAQVKNDGSATFEIMIKNKQGNLMPVEVTGSYLIFEGRELFFTYVKDIQDRKKSEEALQRSTDELRSTKDRALLYLDILGHDIRNKLQGMMLASQLALIGLDDEEIAEAMAIQEKTIDTIQSLITRVKSLEEMISEPLEQRDLVKAVNEMVKQLTEQHPNVDLYVDFNEIQALISADSFLEILIMNILDNAVEHNPSNSQKIWVKLEEDDSGYTLSISDNGPGISDTRKSELLDQNRRYGGIALHQSKFIMDKYGGYLEITDRVAREQHKGAKFRIWFPQISKENHVEP